MRATLHIDSATTEQARAFVLAHHRATGEREQVRVGLNGSDYWTATTPPMSRHDADAMSKLFWADARVALCDQDTQP